MLKSLSQSQRILMLLQDGAIHDVPQILRKCYGMFTASSARVGARIYDLKEQGYDIKSYHIKGTTWAYQLIQKTKWKKKSMNNTHSWDKLDKSYIGVLFFTKSGKERFILNVDEEVGKCGRQNTKSFKFGSKERDGETIPRLVWKTIIEAKKSGWYF